MSTTPVKLGDSVSVEVKDSTPKITITWSQSMQSKSAEYYETEGDLQGNSIVVFVQANMLDKFNKLIHDGKITVDKSFQYGQKDKSGTNRWIVYHNKEYKPYQHRFIEAAWKKGGQNILSRMGVPADALDAAKSWFGDYLHNF